MVIPPVRLDPRFNASAMQNTTDSNFHLVILKVFKQACGVGPEYWLAEDIIKQFESKQNEKKNQEENDQSHLRDWISVSTVWKRETRWTLIFIWGH